MIKETGDEQHQDSERHCGAGAQGWQAVRGSAQADLTDVSRLLKKLAIEAALRADSDDHQAVIAELNCLSSYAAYLHLRTRNFSRLIENVSKTDREALSNHVEETYIYA